MSAESPDARRELIARTLIEAGCNDPWHVVYRCADAVLAHLASVLADAERAARADARDEGVEALRHRCEQMMGRSPFVERAASEVVYANPHRAASEGRTEGH